MSCTETSLLLEHHHFLQTHFSCDYIIYDNNRLRKQNSQSCTNRHTSRFRLFILAAYVVRKFVSCWWNKRGGSGRGHTSFKVFVCVGLCLFSSPCDPFADRPQCSPLWRGYHANAASGETKNEDSLGFDQRHHCFSLVLVLLSACSEAHILYRDGIEGWRSLYHII